MRYLTLLFLLLGSIHQLSAQEIVRITPVTYNQEEGQWYVLLSHDRRCNVWSDFKGRVHPCEDPTASASRILRCESAGFYNLNLAGNIYCKRTNCFTGDEELIFFVPVDFQPIETIRCKARRGFRDNFSWVEAKKVLSSTECNYLTLNSCGKPAKASWGYVEMFKSVWPGVEKGYNEYEDHKLYRKYPNYPLVRDAPQSNCTNISWYRIPCGISFFRKGTAYYEFTTVYPASFRLDGKNWPSVEHYMQAMKFQGQLDVQEQIRQLPTVSDAIKAGSGCITDIEGEPCANWESIMAGHMLRANRAKFDQNQRLKAMLCRTKKAVLVFDTSTSNVIDAYWGAGRSGNGRNILGQILMQIRYEQSCCGLVADFLAEQPIDNFTNGQYFAPASIMR